MPVPIRLRTDNMTAAECHAEELAGKPVSPCGCEDPACSYLPEVYRNVPPAQPGDAWRITWYRQPGETAATPAITPGRPCSSNDATRFAGSAIAASCWTWTLDADGRPITGYHGWLNHDGNSPGILMLPGEWLADLSQHDVTEHEDRTITVSPSVLIVGHTGQRHGYLERGFWRDV